MVDIRICWILAFTLVLASHLSYNFPLPTWLAINVTLPPSFSPGDQIYREMFLGIWGYPPNAILRPYFLGGWHWGGPLRFPWNVSTKMLVGAIFINSIDVVMQRFHRDLHHKNPPNTKVVNQPRHLWSNLMMSIPTKNIIRSLAFQVPMFLRKLHLHCSSIKYGEIQ